MLTVNLKILNGKHRGKVIPLRPEKFFVGREGGCHLRPASDLVSRHHCVFSIDDSSVRLRDQCSRNGTFVNGTRLTGEINLCQGDIVTIGLLEFEAILSSETVSIDNLSTAESNDQGDDLLVNDGSKLPSEVNSTSSPKQDKMTVSETMSADSINRSVPLEGVSARKTTDDSDQADHNDRVASESPELEPVSRGSLITQSLEFLRTVLRKLKRRSDGDAPQ